MRILVVDFLEEPGHIGFIRPLLAAIATRHEVWFASTPQFCCAVGWKNQVIFHGLGRSRRTRWTWQFFQCLQLLRLSLSPWDSYDAVVFSGYETVSMSLMAGLFRPMAPFLIAHNNLDQLKQSRIKKYAFNLLPSNFKHLGLEAFITQFMQSELGLLAWTLPHTIPPRPSAAPTLRPSLNSEKLVVFAPGRGLKPEHLESLAQSLRPVDRFRLIARPSRAEMPIGLECVLHAEFEDYQGILDRADFVYAGGDFEYRVSGVFYEAMAAGCTLLVPPSRFGREMVKAWPNHVILIDKFDSRSARGKQESSGTPAFLEAHGPQAQAKALDIAIRQRDWMLP